MSSPGRTILLVTVIGVVGLVALGGVILLASAGPAACPTALLEGTLEEDPSTGQARTGALTLSPGDC